MAEPETQGYVRNYALWSSDAADFRYTDKNGNVYSKVGTVFKIETPEGPTATYDTSEHSGVAGVGYYAYYQTPVPQVGEPGGYYIYISGDTVSDKTVSSKFAHLTTTDSTTYIEFIRSYGGRENTSAFLAYLGTDSPGIIQYSSFVTNDKYKYAPGGTGKGASSTIAINLDGVYFQSEEKPGVPDPYDSGGTSGTGGGSGTFDRTGDDISVPGLPSLSASSTGFVTLFNPTLTQLNNLASYMWSDIFDIATFKKIFADPMDVILGLSIVPVAVPSSGTAEVKVGNISTGVSMNKASSQYVSVDCGSLAIGEYWGAYLDYAPYTKAEIYLPYCGTHPIDVDEIMGKTISVNYNVDIISGGCCAMIKCGGSVLYHFLGQCSNPIPVSGNDWSSFLANAVRAAASLGTMVATAGASAPASAASQLARETGQIASASSTATSIISMKPAIEKSGSMSGPGGMLGVQTPYLILSFPRQCLPSNQNSIIGYPSYIYSEFSQLNGYTIVDDAHLSIDSATNQEKAEIENLLKSGVIL